MPTALTAIQLALGFVFFYAAFAKAISPGDLAFTLQRSGTPAPRALAIAVPVAEAAGSILLVTASPIALRATFIGTAVLLLLMAAWVGSVVLRGVSVRCACFGADDPVSVRTLVRTGLLFALALIGAVGSWRTTSALPQWSPLTVVALSAAAVSAAVAANVARVRRGLIVTPTAFDRAFLEALTRNDA